MLSRLKGDKGERPIAPKLEEVVARICDNPGMSSEEVVKLLGRAGVLAASACSGHPYQRIVDRVTEGWL